MENLVYSNGWRKIAQNGGTFVIATLYNILTGDEENIVVRDYDYGDCSRDCDYWYNASIDADALRAYNRKHGIIQPGERVMVVKGRNIPRGYVGKVVKVYPVYDRYQRWVADYCRFEDGKKTNVGNCVLIL